MRKYGMIRPKSLLHEGDTEACGQGGRWISPSYRFGMGLQPAEGWTRKSAKKKLRP